MRGIQIGQLLIEQGVLTATQVSEILQLQKQQHRPFGELAETMYGVDPRAIEDAWVEQYIRTVGITDLNDVEIDTDCLRLLNRRQAWQFHTMPVNRDSLNLNCATSPEYLIRAVNFTSKTLDEPVFMVIAERQQLREFLMEHYPVPNFMREFATSMSSGM